MSQYNEKLFRQVLELIKQDRSLWNQETFQSRNYTSSCGTTCCVAGWAVTLTHGKFVPTEDPDAAYVGHWELPAHFERTHNFEVEGASLLGLSAEEANDMFFLITDETQEYYDEDGELLDRHVTYNQMVKKVMEITGLDFSDLLDSEEVPHEPWPDYDR